MSAADRPQDPGEPGQPAGKPDQPAGEPGQSAGEPGQPAGKPGQPAGESSEAAGGVEPDARFTFANERTFLAWTRTALAFVVAGLGIVQLLPPFPGVPWGRHLLGVPLIVLGGVISLVGYGEWAHNQRALRHREPLARSVLPRILTVTIAGMAIVSAVVLLLSAILRP